MKKLDKPAKDKIYDICLVGGDWFDKLDAHEAAYISGTVGNIIKTVNEMVANKKTSREVISYLAAQADNEKAAGGGYMHQLTIKAIEQAAEELNISTLFKTEHKKRSSGTQPQQQQQGWRQVLSSAYLRDKFGIAGRGD